MTRGAEGARQGERKGDFLAGKYLLEDCLGIGGMGEVYRATNVSLGRKVAIKLLSAEYVHIEDDVLRFLREARAAAGIRHNNVVDVLDVARDDDGTPFIVQELLAGEDLERHLRTRGQLSAEEALEIMIPVADAIAAAHAQNVVHRDLKPANIFLAVDRGKTTPKVLDFGACLFPTIADRSAKELRMLIGTPHYMAPEQIVKKADVDARSDVWAIGVILYEMMVGETPFEAETANAVLALVKTRDVPPLRERAKDAPAELEDLIARCTKRDRLERLADAGVVHGEMLALHARLRGASSSAVTPTVPTVETTAAPSSSKSPPTAVDRALTPRSGATVGAVKIVSAPKPRKNKLLTLNSPLSDPPEGFDDGSDLGPMIAPLRPLPEPLAATSHRLPSTPPPPMSAVEPSPHPAMTEPEPALPHAAAQPFSSRILEPDNSPGTSEPLHLAVQPRSSRAGGQAAPSPPAVESPPATSAAPNIIDASPRSRLEDTRQSSIPPVLDPRALPSSPRPRPSVTDEAPLPPPPSQAQPAVAPPRAVTGPRPALPQTPASRTAETWTGQEKTRFALSILLPALVAFALAAFVPALAAPIGRALRGDSLIASGVLTVVTLVAAAALSARSVLGEKKDAWLYVAAGGSILFGIVMIIVTFSASETAELGTPSSMGGLATLIAPVPALALAIHALRHAHAGWLDPYARGEAKRFAALASFGIFLALTLSPIGSARNPAARPPPASHDASGG